jgi:hypothetical protein
MTWNTQRIGQGTLVLHCGGHAVTRQELADAPMPEALGPKHHPIPHLDFVDMITDELTGHDLAIREEAFGLTKDGNRFFGLMELEHAKADYSTLLGLRGAHDQSMARIIGLGTRVWICDNTGWSSTHTIRTKQTTHIMNRLPGLIHEAIGHLPAEIERQDRLIETMQGTHISEDDANGMLIEAVRREVLPPSRMGSVIHLWDRENERVEDEEKLYGDGPTVWTLYNVVTETMRPKDNKGNVPINMNRTFGLTKMLEEELDLAA